MLLSNVWTVPIKPFATKVSNGWTKINTWLDEATKGNSEYKELLLCFAAAVLRGRNDLQKFLPLRAIALLIPRYGNLR
ncbi:MAG: hypothetical protein QNJ65_03995 [Xenococcaceae cyanobacterium MO_234.B1]|nr:hypothetical protein [Xenococcaceae cyanobacterium MO_234.B1]